jgi:hypothetical protein
MNKEELRQYFYAASPFDLASVWDDEYRNVVDCILDKFQNIDAVYKTDK